MKLTYFHGDEPNFGDEINAFLWDDLLPAGFLDDDGADLFLGVGSIIWNDLPRAPVKHIIGSGYGGYTDPPDVSQDDWSIAWVRGPLTAATLGIDPSLAITDAAVLLRAIELPAADPDVGVAFMPHFQSVQRGNWAKVCALAGMTYLDPRADPMRLIAQIKGADLVVSEAMHGAIVADALRTPFVPITPSHASHRAKWLDWSQSMGLDLSANPAPPSSVRDWYIKTTGLRGAGRTSRAVLDHRLLKPLHDVVARQAADKLTAIVRSTTPCLSDDLRIEDVTSRCLEALDGFVRRHRPAARR